MKFFYEEHSGTRFEGGTKLSKSSTDTFRLLSSIAVQYPLPK